MNIPAVTHKGVPLLPVWQIETFFDGGTLVLICKRSKHCLAVLEGHMQTDAHRERRVTTPKGFVFEKRELKFLRAFYLGVEA